MLAREMLAPQKLALMSQLMRRIANAASRGAPASGSVRDEKDAGGSATDLHGIAQLAMRARRSSTSSVDWDQ